jgi:DNA-binding transcriptional MocR family regulator
MSAEQGKRDSVVLRRALELGVEAPALTSYREKPGGRGGLVLGYAAYSEPQLRNAVTILANVIR